MKIVNPTQHNASAEQKEIKKERKIVGIVIALVVGVIALYLFHTLPTMDHVNAIDIDNVKYFGTNTLFVCILAFVIGVIVSLVQHLKQGK